MAGNDYIVTLDGELANIATTVADALNRCLPVGIAPEAYEFLDTKGNTGQTHQ